MLYGSSTGQLFVTLGTGIAFVRVQVGEAVVMFPQTSFAYTVLTVGHAGSFCVPTEQFTVDDRAEYVIPSHEYCGHHIHHTSLTDVIDTLH
jgi:hypothetical protein